MTQSAINSIEYESNIPITENSRISNTSKWSSIGLMSAISTMTSKTVTFPLDTLKCRLQHTSSLNKNVFIRLQGYPWGIRSIFSGLSLKLLFYVPYQCVYMISLEKTKKLPLFNDSLTASVILTELIVSPLRVSMEAVKQRSQAGLISQRKIRYLFKNYGSLYKKYAITQTLLFDIPYSVLQWNSYFFIKDTNRISPWCIGFVSSLTAVVLTNPLDCFKTRTITADTINSTSKEAIVNRINNMFRNSNGTINFKPFTRGLVPRIFHLVPGTGLFLGLYSYLGKYLVL